MEVRATLRYIRISPRKVRLVTDMIHNMSVDEALAQLSATSKRAARPVAKLIRSAVANAEHNFSIDPATLRISNLRVDGGPVLRRYRPKGFGRVALINRRTSHITVVLEGERTEESRAAAQEKKQKKEKEAPRVVEGMPTTEAPTSAPPKKERDFDVKKKEGEKLKEKKKPFIRRFFQRKSI